MNDHPYVKEWLAKVDLAEKIVGNPNGYTADSVAVAVAFLDVMDRITGLLKPRAPSP